jgi:hypothetical protein
MTIHRPCWSTILKYARKPVLRILKLLADKGYGEYYNYFKEQIK